MSQGNYTVRIRQDAEGPTDYVPGRGADAVPSRVGTGGIVVEETLEDQGSGECIEKPDPDEVLVFRGLSKETVEEIKTAVAALPEGKRTIADARAAITTIVVIGIMEQAGIGIRVD